MQSLTEKVWRLKPPLGLFDKTVVANLFPQASLGARKALIHRAMQKKEILSLKPGLFCLAEPFRAEAPHPFVVSCLLLTPSFVSMESALAFHGLIPEAVYQVSCVTSARSRTFNTPLGVFSFYRVPCNFLKAGVKVRKVAEDSWAFIAGPLRAIADIVYSRKSVTWKNDGLDFMVESLRIERDDLISIPMNEFNEVYSSIRSRRTKEYLRGLRKEFAR